AVSESHMPHLPLFFWGFVSLQVPPATSDPLAFISFSAKGNTVNLTERRSVAIENVHNTLFIQTDKPIYKPGQKGCWGAGKSFDVSLSPTPQDPEQNQIFQWLDVSSMHGIIQLSFPLIEEPILGSYHIIVEKTSGDKEYEYFTVEEYGKQALRSLLDSCISSSPRYTYGQPVQGSARINVCQQHFYNPRCQQSQKATCETVTGLITVTNADGKPVASRVVVLEVDGEYQANYTTDENGTAAFSLDTSNFFNPSVKLRPQKTCFPTKYGKREDALFFVRRFYSRTNSFVRIEPVEEKLSCGQQRMINIHYVLNRKGYRNATHTEFYYVVSTTSVPKTVLILKHLSALTLLFAFDLQLEFSEKQALPGSKINIRLEAAANSYCALRAVDQSVFLLQPERELSAESVSHMPSAVDLYGYYYNGLNLQDDQPEECTPVKTTFFDGLYYEPVNVSHDGDVYRIFRVCVLFAFSSIISHSDFLVFFSSTGEANIFYTIPDTITEWKASAFCLQDDAGFGISSPVSLTAFQPFFVDLALPYSVIRGEKINLIANVFNYLDKCIQVYQVPFQFLYGLPVPQSSHTPAEEETIRTDTLTQTLLVEVQYKIYILGTALRNMENLLHMPYGCGEQNMALFTPNIYVLDYLNKTGQLTEEIRVKSTGYLSTGDSSYNTAWVEPGETAESAHTYKGTRRYIYIDENVQSQTLIWLARKQKSDGCFENAESHFNNHPVVRSGMNCLETAFSNGVHNLYNQALFAYVYGLADKQERYQYFLEKLDKRATRDVYWQRENKPPAEHFPAFYSRAPSAEIEMTSYVLLALLNKAKLTPDDLSYISRIVYWLVKQQNPYGGFSSSQVTTGCGKENTFWKYRNTIRVNFMEMPSKAFEVNDKNRFLLWQTSLPVVPGNYSVEVYGTGCNFSHFSYTGNRNVSNMAIIDVKMLSGFIPDRSSLKKSFTQHNTSYAEKVSFSFSVEQSLPVSDIKPAPVHIYDYYETGR
uniref:OVOS protein n=1 Tax=Pavo cristatus TaxID=9049 RepID=A0A8C9G5Q1_PAVCR